MKCKKCGSEHLKLEQRSHETNDIMKAQQVALVCGDCGFWQKWCPKEERHHYIKKAMTNREWLNGLSDEELAIYLKQKITSQCMGCYYHTYPTLNRELPCKEDCLVGHVKWLKAKHKELEK